MSSLILPTGYLYIMSGPPGSGKSTLLNSIQPVEGSVISTDKLRRELYGYKPYLRDGNEHEHLYGWDSNSNAVFEIAQMKLRERAKERLTTFIDSTNVTDSDRAEWAKIAQAYGMPVRILNFDVSLEELLERNENRRPRIDPDVIKGMYAAYQRQSRFSMIDVTNVKDAKLLPEVLDGDAQPYDIVSDTHGLFDEFMELLKKRGYVHNEDGIPYHPEGRKLLFLGDAVDRGTQSLLLLHYIEQAVRKGGHIFVPGNHEDKLYKSWETWHRTGEAKGRSRSSTETLLNLMRLPMEDQKRLMYFVRDQDPYRIVRCNNEEFLCLHSDITHFDPHVTPKSAMFYGASDYGRLDSDAKYEEGYAQGWNKYTLIRGHIPQISHQRHAFSIEHEQAFGGDLAMLALDSFAKDLHRLSPEEAKENNTTKYRVQFNYDEYSRYYFTLADTLSRYAKEGVFQRIIDKTTGLQMYKLQDLEKLMNEKLIKCSMDPQKELQLMKYGKEVFFQNLWHRHPFLLKARGLVLDMAGHIVQHPFDKVFNYGENQAGLHITDDTLVDAPEKLNGFLACITKHPLREELLVTTTGSFDSPYVTMIKQLLTPEQEKRLLEHFNNLEKGDPRKGQTLMFEAIHPDDKEHPIAYEPKDHGLWLIGARGRDVNAKLESEQYLDLLGGELGFRRPKVHRIPFKTLRQWAKEHKIEGYMARDINTGEIMVKFKTAHYLSTKLMARLSDKNVAFLYANPVEFKRKRVDEEYWPIVDALIKKYPTAEDFKAVPKEQRMEMVRELIADVRQEQEAHPDQVQTGLDL